MCAAGTAAWSSRLWPCHRRACIQAQTPHWGYRPSRRRYDGAGRPIVARWRLIRSSFRRTPESRSAPGYEPMCLAGKACGRAVCGLATVKRASKLKRRTGYRPAPVRRRGAPIRPGGTSYARHSGEGRNPDRRPDMNQCACGQGLWSSHLWPCHRRACIQTQTPHWYRPAPVRRNETLAAILRCRTSTTGWTAGARPPLLRRYDGLEGQCLCASQCRHQRRRPEARPPQAPPARHSGEGRNPDRRPDMNQRAPGTAAWSSLCGLATVERASTSNAHWVPACAGTTTMGHRSPVAPHTLVIPAKAGIQIGARI